MFLSTSQTFLSVQIYVYLFINISIGSNFPASDISLEVANQHKTEWFTGVHTCTINETLHAVIERLGRGALPTLLLPSDAEDYIYMFVPI